MTLTAVPVASASAGVDEMRSPFGGVKIATHEKPARVTLVTLRGLPTTAGVVKPRIVTTVGSVLVKSAASPPEIPPGKTQLTAAFAVPRPAVSGSVTVTAALAGVLLLPPTMLIVWLESGGADPEGSVNASAQGVG